MLLTQPCLSSVETFEWHILPLPPMCPVSDNPQPGSTLFVLYRPVTSFLEVYSLRTDINTYIGGRGAIRDMEGTIQQIAQDCSNAIQAYVVVGAIIRLQRGDSMALMCNALPLIDPLPTLYRRFL